MYKMLLICNEVKNFINNKKYDSTPLKIEEDDRRFLVMERSSEKRGNQEYFSQLYRSFTPEF